MQQTIGLSGINKETATKEMAFCLIILDQHEWSIE